MSQQDYSFITDPTRVRDDPSVPAWYHSASPEVQQLFMGRAAPVYGQYTEAKVNKAINEFLNMPHGVPRSAPRRLITKAEEQAWQEQGMLGIEGTLEPVGPIDPGVAPYGESILETIHNRILEALGIEEPSAIDPDAWGEITKEIGTDTTTPSPSETLTEWSIENTERFVKETIETISPMLATYPDGEGGFIKEDNLATTEVAWQQAIIQKIYYGLFNEGTAARPVGSGEWISGSPEFAELDAFDELMNPEILKLERIVAYGKNNKNYMFKIGREQAIIEELHDSGQISNDIYNEITQPKLFDQGEAVAAAAGEIMAALPGKEYDITTAIHNMDPGSNDYRSNVASLIKTVNDSDWDNATGNATLFPVPQTLLQMQRAQEAKEQEILQFASASKLDDAVNRYLNDPRKIGIIDDSEMDAEIDKNVRKRIISELLQIQSSLDSQGVSDLEIARIMVDRLDEYIAPPPPPRPFEEGMLLQPSDIHGSISIYDDYYNQAAAAWIPEQGEALIKKFLPAGVLWTDLSKEFKDQLLREVQSASSFADIGEIVSSDRVIAARDAKIQKELSDEVKKDNKEQANIYLSDTGILNAASMQALGISDWDRFSTENPFAAGSLAEGAINQVNEYIKSVIKSNKEAGYNPADLANQFIQGKAISPDGRLRDMPDYLPDIYEQYRDRETYVPQYIDATEEERVWMPETSFEVLPEIAQPLTDLEEWRQQFMAGNPAAMQAFADLGQFGAMPPQIPQNYLDWAQSGAGVYTVDQQEKDLEVLHKMGLTNPQTGKAFDPTNKLELEDAKDWVVQQSGIGDPSFARLTDADFPTREALLGGIRDEFSGSAAGREFIDRQIAEGNIDFSDIDARLGEINRAEGLRHHQTRPADPMGFVPSFTQQQLPDLTEAFRKEQVEERDRRRVLADTGSTIFKRRTL